MSETYSTFVTLAGGDGVPEDLLESAWRASGRRIGTALSIVKQVLQKKPAPLVAPKPAPLRPTSTQPKLSFAAATAATTAAATSAVAVPQRVSQPPAALHTAAARPAATASAAPPGPRRQQPECIDLLSSSDEAADDDEEGVARKCESETAARDTTSDGPSWSRELPLLSVLCPCLVKGAFSEVTPATPLAVWHEVAAAAAYCAPAGGKRGRAAAGRAPFSDPFADVDAPFTSTNVRFGPGGGTALGRLPPELSRWLAPLLDLGLASAVCRLPFRPDVLSIAANLDVDVVVTIHEAAQRLLRGGCRGLGAAAAPLAAAGAGNGALTGSITTPLDKALRQALFEVCYYCTHGRPPAQPSQTGVAARATSGSAAAATPAPFGSALSAVAASTDAGAADEEGAAAVADNAEERVSEAEALSLQAALEQAPRLPLAAQPALMPGLRLRLYQRQALAWMVGREKNCAPEGENCDKFATPAQPALGDVQESGLRTVPDADVDASALESLREQQHAHDVAIAAVDKNSSARAAFGSAAALWERSCFADGVTDLWLNPYTHTASLAPPPRIPPCLSGILTDEMGLGKTAEFVSLIMAQKGRAAAATSSPGESSPSVNEAADDDADPSLLPSVAATLVVAPMSMLGQWRRELSTYTAGAATVRMHYGADRLRSVRDLAGVDVVLTSYGTLASEYEALLRRQQQQRAVAAAESVGAGGTAPRRATASVLGMLEAAGASGGGSSSYAAPIGISGAVPILYGVLWLRCGLDEAHLIRNRATKVAKACFEIAARHRWALTGTPLQNSLQDLYSLLRFVRAEPWSELRWWKHAIADPHAAGDPRAMAALHTILRPLLLRRTKAMRDVDGSRIGNLAPATIIVVRVPLDREERSFYDALYARSKQQFEAFAAVGAVMSKYAAVFALLLRLRQACDHPYLVVGSAAALVGRGMFATTAGKSVCAAAAAAVSTAPRQRADAAALRAEGAPANDDLSDDEDAAGAPPEVQQALPPGLIAELYSELLLRRVHVVQPPLQQVAVAAAAPAHIYSGTAPSALPPLLPEFVCTQLGTLASEGIADRECPICLCELTVGSAAIVAACGHLLCDACLAQLAAPRCPVCRVDMGGASALSGAVRVAGVCSSGPAAAALRRPLQLALGSGGRLTRLAGNSSAAVSAPASERGVAAATATDPPLEAAAAAAVPLPPPRTLEWHKHVDHSRLRGGVSQLPWRSSSKLDALVEDLVAIAAHNRACAATSATSSVAAGSNGKPRAFFAPARAGAAVGRMVEHAEQSDEEGFRTTGTCRSPGCSDSSDSDFDGARDCGGRKRERGRQNNLRRLRGASAAAPPNATPAAAAAGGVDDKGRGVDAAVAVAACPAPPLVADVAGMRLSGAVKAVIFSSFTFMLDIVDVAMRAVGIGAVRFDGSMSRAAREASLAAFRADPAATVLVVSLKAGGLGLNLQDCASIVYLLDPWWNAEVERQALSRVHRLGQTRAVYVKRFVVHGTVEDEILAIQERKLRLAQDALGAAGAGGCSSVAASKLSEDDLRGFFRL